MGREILDTILEHKRDEIAAAKGQTTLSEMRSRVQDVEPARGFHAAIAADPRPVALIAEVKKASPSEGLIRPDFEPASIAASYRAAGATCLSVLTDRQFFQGAPEYLSAAREVSGLPALRKDFVLEAYQVYESRSLGADAILLIAAVLDDPSLHELRSLSEGLGMDALVEVHDEAEMERALESGAKLIGINNRDLGTFTTDLGTTARLAKMAPGHVTLVSESAINSSGDVEFVSREGARAVLVGTAFCREPNIEGAVRRVMGW